MSTLVPRPLLGRPLRNVDLIAIDVALALVLSAVSWYAALEDAPGGVREPAWVSAAAGVLVGAPLMVRRLRPLSVLIGVVGASTVVLLTGVIPDYASVPVFIIITFALYTVSVERPRRVSIPALAGALAAVSAMLGGTVALGLGAATGPREIGFVSSLVVAAWALGRVAHERRAHAARTARQQTQRAVVDERLRIAREMHDIVAHSMTLIAVKAAVGNHVAETNPQEARDALRVIESTSRHALVEIRRALGLLREGTSDIPAAGLADLTDLTDLVEQAAAGGVHLDLTMTGDGDLPQDVKLSVYRIMQESLTNVIQHAAPARCHAVVAIEPTQIRIDVTDDGRRASGPIAGGHGLIGMRERVGMYGGQFTAGPRPEGGFRVSARLPYTPQT